MRLAVLTAALAAGACGSGTAPGNGASICTLIGCTDEFTATLHDTTGGLPSGKQVLTVTANGTTLTCSFTLPRPATGGITCPKGLTVSVVQAQTCVTSGTGQYQTLTCTPVAGKFNEVVAIVGSPTTLHVNQTVDGATYLDQTTT